MAGGNVFEARYSATRSLLLGLGSLAFVAVGLWVAGVFGEIPDASRRIPDWAFPIIGWISVITFGAFGIFHFRRMLTHGISVRVDNLGMIIADYSADHIPWSEFTEIRSQNVMGTNLLLFEVTPEREASFGLFRRLLWPLNRSTSGLGGSLVLNNTDQSHADCVEAICEYAPPRLTQYLR